MELATFHERKAWRSIRSKTLRVLTIARGLKCLVEREGHITGDREVVEGNIDKSLGIASINLSIVGARCGGVYLLRLAGIHRQLDLPEALADEEGSVNQHTVGGTVDFEVAEQNICAEQGQDLIHTVVRFTFGGNVQVGGIRRERG